MDAARGVAEELPDAPGERRRRRAIALAVGLVLVAVCVAATLSGPAKGRLGTNDVPVDVRLPMPGGAPVCQGGELVPAGTAAIRVALAGDPRTVPRLALTLSERGAVRAAGGADARWDGGSAVRVPLAHALRRDVAGTLCLTALAPGAGYLLRGALATASEAATAGGQPLPARVHVEYLASGASSWWASAATIARRAGLGHAWSGASVPLLALLLTLCSIAVGAWQLVRSDG